MAIPTSLADLTGRWQGANRLWLDPNEAARESVATAVCQQVAQGKFFELHYTWADEGQPQAGVLLLGQSQEKLTAAWVDSWHMQDTMMHCTGKAQTDDAVSVIGYYAAPPDPDWGWRIALQPDSANQFRLIMYNITPDGEEMLAVEAVFSREK
ncbi:MAG: hypothetical protein CL608_25260 [Anaerolineaceae bacterium]|nr:hypothetical protein [Anaerolineaceae bacterium]